MRCGRFDPLYLPPSLCTGVAADGPFSDCPQCEVEPSNQLITAPKITPGLGCHICCIFDCGDYSKWCRLTKSLRGMFDYGCIQAEANPDYVRLFSFSPHLVPKGLCPTDELWFHLLKQLV